MRKGYLKGEAITLNSFDFQESDRIITFFSKKHGKRRAIAKGARRSKKRFVGNLEPLSHINFICHFNQKTGLLLLEEANLINPFKNLKFDIHAYLKGSTLSELVSVIMRDAQVIDNVYNLFLGFLTELDKDIANGRNLGDEWLRFFEIKFLSLVGFMPRLDVCIECEEEFYDKGIFIAARGGIICSSCRKKMTVHDEGILISAGTAKVLNSAIFYDKEKLRFLKLSEKALKESERMLKNFIHHQIGHGLKTDIFKEKLISARH